jgi:hypothetical protein
MGFGHIRVKRRKKLIARDRDFIGTKREQDLSNSQLTFFCDPGMEYICQVLIKKEIRAACVCLLNSSRTCPCTKHERADDSYCCARERKRSRRIIERCDDTTRRIYDRTEMSGLAAVVAPFLAILSRTHRSARYLARSRSCISGFPHLSLD